MYCPKCGKEVPDNAAHCPNCGAAMPNVPKTKNAEPHEYHKPEGYVGMVPFILLMVFTCGIYYLMSIYRMTKVTNNDKTEAERRPALQLLACMFIPIYAFYWMYKTSQRADNMLGDNFDIKSDTKVLNLLLSIFGFSFVAMVILQDTINKALGGATGASPNSTGIGVCKNCGAQFPDDKRTCPECGTPYKKPVTRKLWFSIVIAVIGFFLILALAITACFAISKDITGAAPLQDYSVEDEEPTYDEISILNLLQVQDYKYTSSDGKGVYVLKVGNGTNLTLDLSCDVDFMDANGNVIGSAKDSVKDVPSGMTVIMTFESEGAFENAKRAMHAVPTSDYEPVSQNLKISASQAEDVSISFTVTNSGIEDAEDVIVSAVYYNGNGVADVQEVSVDDIDPSESADGSSSSASDWTNVELYIAAVSD